MTDDDKVKLLEQIVPDGYVYIILPEEDVVHLLSACAAAEMMFRKFGVKATPAGFTLEKCQDLARKLIAVANAPERKVTYASGKAPNPGDVN